MKPLPGRIKSQPEDFGVTELPAFSPEGSGDHLYLWVSVFILWNSAESRSCPVTVNKTRSIAMALPLPLLR